MLNQPSEKELEALRALFVGVAYNVAHNIGKLQESTVIAFVAGMSHYADEIYQGKQQVKQENQSFSKSGPGNSNQ